MASDVIRVAKTRLGPRFAPFGPVLPVYTVPYGTDPTPDVQTLKVNNPVGWVYFAQARAGNLEALYGRWILTIDAVAATDAQAEKVARAVVNRLHGTPRNPTAFAFQGDSPVIQVTGVSKHVLTFLATIRHGE